MKNILTIDIGNTNITAGIFTGARLAGKVKIPTRSVSVYSGSIRRLLSAAGVSAADVDAGVVSSVVPLALSRLIKALNEILECPISITGRDVNIPIRNLYRIKSEVGQDRLVNAYAAGIFYGAPAVIIDFGTAITFDIASRGGDYLGGLILPGIGMGLAALHEKTALLPKVELKKVHRIIGKDTVSSMRGGILFGYGAMCDGLVAQYKKMLGKGTKVVATGGNADLIRRYAKSIRIVDEDITLKGLLLISALT